MQRESQRASIIESGSLAIFCFNFFTLKCSVGAQEQWRPWGWEGGAGRNLGGIFGENGPVSEVNVIVVLTEAVVIILDGRMRVAAAGSLRR